MTSDADLRADLRTLARRWEQITAVPEMPRSLMNVIEYSLGNQGKGEVYVTRLLRYFLDPEEPHGLDADFLRTFLEELPADCDFDEDIYDLSDVRIDRQVTVEEEVSGSRESRRTGLADIVIEEPNEWFLLVELKFSAGENNLRGDGLSQTEFYHEVPRIGDRRKDEYESGEYYLYIHPEDEHEAEEDQFANWSWEDFAIDVLEEVLTANAPRYPQRTVVQLRELKDDIEKLSGMTERQASDREKMELYLEHYDAIKDVSETFDERWEAFNDRWASELSRALEEETEGETERPSFRAKSADDYLDRETVNTELWSIVDESERSDNSGRLWTFRAKDNDWAHIFKQGWWRRKSDLASIHARDENYEDVRISFIHRFSNRDLAVGDRTLKFYFRNCGSNDGEFRNEFNRRLDDRKDEIRRHLPEAAKLTGERRNRIVAEYEISITEHEDFFEAYTAALKRAFIDHAIEHPELIDVLDSIYENSLAMYEE